MLTINWMTNGRNISLKVSWINQMREDFLMHLLDIFIFYIILNLKNLVKKLSMQIK